MTEREHRRRRYAELMDRESMGEPLTDEERAFCARLAAEDPACGREAAMLAELAQLDAPPTAASRALVDAALARLANETAKAEREQLSQLRGVRVPRIAWAFGAAAALALGIGTTLLPAKPEAPEPTAAPAPKARIELVYASGEVTIDGRAVGSSTKLLAEGSTIEVARGSACVAMDPGIDVCLGDQSQVVLSRMQNPWRRIDLLSGKVAVQLEPQPQGSYLSIVADDIWSTAVGTAFTVVRRPGAGVRTTVLHGKVRVGSDGGSEQLVSEHQRAHVQDGMTALGAISRGDEAPEWALLRPVKLWSNPVSATLEVQEPAGSSEVVLDGQLIGRAPLSSLIPAGAHRIQLRRDGALWAEREFISEAGERTVLSFADELAEASVPEVAVVPETKRSVRRRGAEHDQAAEPAAVADVSSAADILGEARRLMRGQRFEEAADRYHELRASHPESPEAHTVLVSLAEVQLDRLGAPEQALESLELYLRSGRGSLVEEARQVRIRALRKLGRASLETEAIAEFLREHPRSFKAAALARRLEELRAH